MEKKKYVTFDKRLISNLEVFGFKRKNQNVFLRMQNEALQTIRIVHSTHGERFVKHYCVSLHGDQGTNDHFREQNLVV